MDDHESEGAAGAETANIGASAAPCRQPGRPDRASPKGSARGILHHSVGHYPCCSPGTAMSDASRSDVPGRHTRCGLPAMSRYPPELMIDSAPARYL